MKTLIGICLLVATLIAQAQSEKAENIFIITTDGFRWQEVFNGADSLLINDTAFVKDIALAKQLYWDGNADARRKKLMPFFWNVLAKEGQLYGNRTKESKVNVGNLYKISYPGYNELLTGYADPLPVLNVPRYNRNISVLEYLNGLPDYQGRIVAFSSWNLFPFILNKKRNAIFQNSGYELLEDDREECMAAANEVQQRVEKKFHTRYDGLTFFNAKEYIRLHHPRVVFLSFGETDEAAHQGRYDLYLQQAANVDKMVAELWYYVQTDPQYKNKTTFLISTDHGRGKKEAKWTGHNTFINGSGEIWLALLGTGIAPTGEMNNTPTVYQKQIAATAAFLLGETFISNHKAAPPVRLPAAVSNNAAPFPVAVAKMITPITAEK